MIPSSPPQVTIPPGWYPDPWQVAGWRWWDGDQWTGHVGGPTAYQLPPRRPVYPEGDLAATVASWPAVIVGLVGAVILSAVGAVVAETLDVASVVGGVLGVWTGLATAVALAARHSHLRVRQLFAAPRTLRRWSAAIGIGFGCGLLIRIASGLAGLPFVHWVESESRTRVPIDGTDVSGTLAVTLAVVAICVGAPLLEELFFRGVLLPTLTRRLTLRVSIVVQAAVFAMLHLSFGIGPATAAFTFAVIGVAGAGLAIVRVRTHSLVPAVMAHASFNAVAVVAHLLYYGSGQSIGALGACLIG